MNGHKEQITPTLAMDDNKMTDLPHMPPDDRTSQAANLSLDEFQTALRELQPRQAVEIFLYLLSQPALKRNEKLDWLLNYLEALEQIETLGTVLSTHSFTDVLNLLINRPNSQNILSRILVGLPDRSFSDSLNYLNSEQLLLFKQEALLEPLRYHINQFIHEGESICVRAALLIEGYESKLPEVEIENLTHESLHTLSSQIDQFKIPVLDYLEKTNTALSIAWSTEQSDLIEKLSAIHERTHHLLIFSLGHRASDLLPATGLFQKLNRQLSTIFDTSLKDEDRSVEGLTRLSIWHLQDYWKLGLLPQIRDPQELNVEQTGDELETVNRHLLFSQVQKELELLKIGTVGDLKRERLFSKHLLETYIAKNRHLLVV